MRHLLPLLLALSSCVTDEGATPADSGAVDCDSASDADADGLDDCAEAELGTDPSVADTDGDGLSDGEEADCVSDPTNAAEVCYACGWPHNDPGTYDGVGPAEGDTIANLELIDQCGERVDLWDLSGSWHVLFMTASWCGSCLIEAQRFDEERDLFVATTGLEFSFVTAIFQDNAGALPDAAEAAEYAERAEITGQPVVSDPIAGVLSSTPYDGTALPGVCALSPEMELLACSRGNTAVADMLEEIRQAAGAAR